MRRVIVLVAGVAWVVADISHIPLRKGFLNILAFAWNQSLRLNATLIMATLHRELSRVGLFD